MAVTNPTLTLILGGARSGKSSYAEALAPKLGQHVLYVATAEALDDEMRARVAAHRARRPIEWTTLEAPLQVGAALEASEVAAGTGVILLDCLTLLVSNVLLSLEADDPESPEVGTDLARSAVQVELDALLSAHCTLGAHMIVVSNEVGLGLVPPYRLGRIYRDCLGAGLPVDLKSLPLAWLE
jgi:adenosylcobinamide kinase/adenosylcobinamide-phosphate guanylyltransferase